MRRRRQRERKFSKLKKRQRAIEPIDATLFMQQWYGRP